MGLFALQPVSAEGGSDDGIIRLKAPRGSAEVDSPTEEPGIDSAASPRRGFDYGAFESRLESLWFQRKTLLADGRDADAVAQSREIRNFCAEEGVRRLESLAGALLAESKRFSEQGHYQRALDSLELAEAVDPGRPQVQFARSGVIWRSGGGRLVAIRSLLEAGRTSLIGALEDLSLFNQLALVVLVATVATLVLFSLMMVVRYQVPFRHEVEEWVGAWAGDRWAGASGWAALFLPIVLWIGAGWIVLYWILITFRFMHRSERITAVVLLAGAALTLPGFQMAVSAYGMTADPSVRTTLAAAGGEYDPDRILRLRRLVDAHPDDPVYRFLLAGMYKSGRYLEESFDEYKQALTLNPTLHQAHVNLGNIFYATGQYAEAIAHYREALTINPRLILAMFNLHLAQSEAFRFREAEETLREARTLDARGLADLFAAARTRGERPTVLDASLHMSSVWQAALSGGQPRALTESAAPETVTAATASRFVNPISLASVGTLLACGIALLLTGRNGPARRCIRCGRPFCHYCKSGREGQEYCSQCHHLFVLGDGLAPETKTRKMWEVERYERTKRRLRGLVSWLLPGSAQVLKGRAVAGGLLLLAWLAGLIAWQPAVLAPLERVSGIRVGFDLMRRSAVPAIYEINAVSVIAIAMLSLIWMLGNLWRVRRREA